MLTNRKSPMCEPGLIVAPAITTTPLPNLTSHAMRAEVWTAFTKEKAGAMEAMRWATESRTQNVGRPVNKGPEQKQFRLILFRFAYLQHIPSAR